MFSTRRLRRLGEIPSPLAALAACCRTLVVWQRRAQERHRLQSLDEQALGDMGIDPADAWTEAGKPFWRR